jgi:hypothetical protein
MNVKKIKRICGVRGCKNTANVYALSKTREMGNSVVMCSDCMKDALSSVEHYVEPAKVKTERKPLFYHPELDVTLSSVADEPKPVEVIEAVAEDTRISVAEDTVTIEKPKTEPKPNNANKKPTKKK